MLNKVKLDIIKYVFYCRETSPFQPIFFTRLSKSEIIHITLLISTSLGYIVLLLFFYLNKEKSTTLNAFSPSSTPLKEVEERSSIAPGVLPVKTKPEARFTLRGERYASSSRLQVLPLLGNKDGTRTIEMILVSTVLEG